MTQAQLQSRELNRLRVSRFRRKRRADAEYTIEVWIDPASDSRLAALRRPGESKTQVIRRALRALEAQEGQPSPSRTPAIPVDRMTSNDSKVTSNAPDIPPVADLSDAQAQLIALWEQGLEVKAIAAALGITWTAAQSRAHRLQQQGLIQPRPRGGDYPSRRAQARQPPETP